MKKILLAFDGNHFSEGAFEFARKLNERRRILLTGIFLPEVDFALLSSYSEVAVTGLLTMPIVETHHKYITTGSIEKFEKLCNIHLIDYNIHNDSIEFALPQIKKETRFSDLLILGSQSFYKNLGGTQPNQYLEDTLHNAECPVVVVPENFHFPQTNILAYDGSASSVYAIKQFAYLFPELAVNPSILVFQRNNKAEELPDEANIQELVGKHFHDLEIFNFDADPKAYFLSWLKRKNSAILVSGSYGRSGFSRMFHKSFLSQIIEDHHIPVFISHQNN